MAGSDFSEATKEQARRLAFFKCCYCHERPGDDVHHLIPKEEDGIGELNNAILLCVQCHADSRPAIDPKSGRSYGKLAITGMKSSSAVMHRPRFRKSKSFEHYN